ncbi:MAG: endonuclease [Sphingomonas bacterium]|uniref:endonuclease/exonuclease/phosphatase family protein n=1 Tax=Sphingomonas bacterium TaxID=1895847 RepID=UPI002610F1CF|nr:endonuclease/exonuclease/phosphatase family protein [Sphingomonas bacterium]MDB5695750.1 endonuclease [Sphingomonas bacterium]
MIKVASYNIRKGVGLDRKRSPERILDVLREIDADVIALQEADRRFGARSCVISPHLLDERSDWQAVALGMRAASMGWHGNALLVRKAATVQSAGPVHLPALEPRGAVTADVTLPQGVAIRVVGMHLDLSGLWRRRQAAAVMAHVDHAAEVRPTVLMGDLNEWTAAGGCLRDFHRHYRSAETGPSFHARKPMGRLDRIMVSPDLTVVDCGVHTTPAARIASDHLPIWAVLDVAPLPLAGGVGVGPEPDAAPADHPDPFPSREREGK